jgi:DNA-binding transcriptional LysR family regulator
LGNLEVITADMGQGDERLRIAFDARLPAARWGPMFQVLVLEQPGLRLEWQPNGFPTDGVLDGADAGIFLHPPARDDLRSLTLDASPMVVAMAVGHRLSLRDELRVADVLDEPFPGAPAVDPRWTSFWTLDAERGAPARRTGDVVADAAQALDVVASGRAIITLATWLAGGLAHPGIITLPLADGPIVETRLVWHAGDDNHMIAALVDLARAWTAADGG